MKCPAHFASPIALPCCIRVRSSQSERKKRLRLARIHACGSSLTAFRKTWPKRRPWPPTSKNTCGERRHSNDNRSKSWSLRPGMLCHPVIRTHLPHQCAVQQGHRFVPHLFALCRGDRTGSICAFRRNHRGGSEGGTS